MQLHHWIPGFAKMHPWFSQFSSTIPHKWSNQETWPGLQDYNQRWSQQKIFYHVGSGKEIVFVPQKKLLGKYEHSIYETGEIPTRENNWHDFFNFLVWTLMPNTKIALNAAHVRYSGESARTSMQSTLAQFDETGMIVCAHEDYFLELLWTHQWTELFIKYRDQLPRKLKFIIFGHGLLEKSLSPFLGMTGKSVLVKTNKDIFDLPDEELRSQLDIQLAAKINTENFLQHPPQLAPLPMLGIPGWWSENLDPSFYYNEDYFRPCRQYALQNPLAFLCL